MDLDAKTEVPACVLVRTNTDVFQVPRKEAELCVLIRTMLECDKDCTEIPVSVDADLFKLVLEFMHRHVDHPLHDIDKPLKTGPFQDALHPSDTEYATWVQAISFETCQRLIAAVNYLDIPPLFELLSAHFADLIMHAKNVQEIRDMFYLENDFTPEEEKQIAEENKWAEENN